jgi:hypothetical protein
MMLLPPQVFPERAHYRHSLFHISIGVSRTRQGVPAKRDAETSTFDVRAEATDVYDFGWKFDLHEPGTDRQFGWGHFESERGGFIPECIDAEGDTCFFTVEMVYDHDFALEHGHLDEEEIAERREKARRILDRKFDQ